MIWPSLDEKKRQILADENVIIIMGRGHSGTRIMTRICEKLGINLGATDELKSGDCASLYFTRTIKKVAIHDIDCNLTNSRKTWLQNRFNRSAYKYFHNLKPEGMWGWKFPETYLIGPYVRKTFPKARYIHLLRDGRDLAFKNHLTDDPNRKLGKVLLDHINALDDPHHLQAAASWACQVSAWDTFANDLPENSVLDLRFEDLVNDPWPEIEKIASFLKIPITQECRDFVSEEIDTSKAAQHRENPPEKIKEVIKEIGPVLEDQGYLEENR